MSYSAEEFKLRTKQFVLRMIRLVNSLPQDKVAQTLGSQLLRSGTSVGANYRAACRGRSAAEFRSKMGIVEEEVDESTYWIALLIEASIIQKERLEDLIAEANEILSITVASIKTSRQT